jgi:hypothetical protein
MCISVYPYMRMSVLMYGLAEPAVKSRYTTSGRVPPKADDRRLDSASLQSSMNLPSADRNIPAKVLRIN